MWLEQPFEGTCKITSPFGERIHPVHKTKRFHRGVDISMPVGTVLRATVQGIVLNTVQYKSKEEQVLDGYGLYSQIFFTTPQGNSMFVLFGHLSKFEFSPNKKINPGEVLALSGDTGTSTAPHLHLSVGVLQGNKWIYIDPEKVFRFIKEKPNATV